MYGNEAPVDFTLAAAYTLHSVVHIRTEYEQKSSLYDLFFGFDNFKNPFNWGFPYNQGPQKYIATGSGVIISSDGYIVTNNHVVQDADVITVTLNDKHSYTAKIIGTDPASDIALIKIDASNLPFIRYGNSDSVRVGEWVLAVGNPFNLTSTVTAGIVSAKARNINVFGGGTDIKSFIQTDAAVNPGNSGGALVNTKGELIGINTAIASNTGSYTGYSFAIPVNVVRKVIDDLLLYGVVQKAYLGVTINEIDSKFAEEKGIEDISGVYVNGVEPNGAADIAGIKEGDIILSIEKIPVNSLPELLEVINQHRPGETIAVDIRRGNKIKTISVILKNKNGTTEVVTKKEANTLKLLGATFEEAPENELKRLGLQYGVKVTSIEGGKFRAAGIKP
ncbi:MAG TPA: trypsin-like peptidase domain-containing protein, partial [Bacteroidales bacterium]|nr:trypsin-like peptidase domain-containing protein [Bacteroidales bacterium]